MTTEVEIADKQLKVLGIQPKVIHARGGPQGGPFAKQTDRGRLYIWCDGWTPEDLEAIAAYKRANQ